jgi:hypothetical protein
VKRIERIVAARKGLLLSKPGEAQKNDVTAKVNMKKNK